MNKPTESLLSIDFLVAEEFAGVFYYYILKSRLLNRTLISSLNFSAYSHKIISSVAYRIEAASTYA